MRIVHANWTGARLHLWGEDAAALRSGQTAPAAGDGAHPFACDPDELRHILETLAVPAPSASSASITLRLPERAGRPVCSPRLARSVGAGGDEADDPVSITPWRVPTLALSALDASVALERLEERCIDAGADAPGALHVGAGVRFFAACARLGRSLMAEQRFVPMLLQSAGGELAARWQPWWSDQRNADRVGQLLAATPPIARAVDDAFANEPWPILEDFLTSFTDEACRSILHDDGMHEAIEGWDGRQDLHVAWLAGLLSQRAGLELPTAQRSGALSSVRRWIGLLDDRGADVGWRLCLKVSEPLVYAGTGEGVEIPGEDVRWKLSFLLQSAEREGVLLDAAEIWATNADVVTVDGRRVEAPGEILLAELSRAARIYPALEKAIADERPVAMELSTREAHKFLTETGPLLAEQGIGVIAPTWWDSPATRLGVMLHIDAQDERPSESDDAGLAALVGYRWSLAVGDTDVTLSQLEQLARGSASLVRIGGRWVEIRPDDVAAAARFLRENPGGEKAVGELMRLAFASDISETGVEISGVDARGWVSKLLGLDEGESRLDPSVQPTSFKGELRPYQLRGLSWLAFLEQFGLGACLADDMGLGKTIQVLALLQRERERAGDQKLGPTLIIAPMSVVGNWRREAQRFAPDLQSLVHHGVERASGDNFVQIATSKDIVITTYALAHRDSEDLARVAWRRVVLDEAQSVKNPTAKQSRAVRQLTAPRRLALTGTPVENRLSELWSIMDFCNPGYLGPAAEFRRRFSVPIERRHDPRRSDQLRRLVRPFVLRRLKTDPTVIADLPEKIESKEYCPLTAEQAALYEATVSEMLAEVDRAEGIRRRGAVLATLVKLKQICNHPSQALGDFDERSGPASLARSGKAARLVEMLDEALSAGDQALVFTQFREMGRILVSILTHELDREVLFLHGGTPQTQREALIERFQEGGKAPIFVLSLKAGGLGMNLTAANHVFHFDRWWNPAVENQATDRAYRIGQTRNVQVHKFIVAGTLEERIDEMIEQKTELAENIIGAGEQWLTELSTNELRDLLSLRKEALVD